MQKANALFSAIQESRSCETKQDLANQLTIHLYRISQIELESFVSKQVCMAMKEQLGDFGLTEEKAMLDVFEIISERGANISSKYVTNKFYEYFDSAELVEKIEETIIELKQSKDQKDEDWMNSDLLIQLAHICCSINKSQWIGKKILKICSELFRFNIQSFIDRIKQRNNRIYYWSIYNDTIQNNQLEYEIMNGVKSLRALAYASEWPSNRDYFAQECSMIESISPLLHINCHVELKC